MRIGPVAIIGCLLALVACETGEPTASDPGQNEDQTTRQESAETASQASNSAPAAADAHDSPLNGDDLSATGWTAMPLPSLVAALDEGAVTSEALVTAYLDRIARIDAPRPGGPSLQGILALNPDALALARTRDAERASGMVRGPLHGIPILLKDNIESADPLPTTAGALALAGNVTGRDSPLVAGLRAQGAIILGKTNLSQWANFRSELSLSGWSALGGQVRNPHVLDRNPCGSSSGSGAAIAASLAAGAVGTETNGSIICPSNVNGIVGFKPTVGLVSQDFIVPISSTQDTAGPMTRSVRGAAMMMDAMVTADRAGPSAPTRPSAATSPPTSSFAESLDAGSLEGLRIGVLRFSAGRQPDILAAFDAALATLEAAGAVLVEIDGFEPYDGYGRDSYGLLQYEFKATLNAYLERSPADLPIRSLEDLIEFNRQNAERELALFGQDILELSETRAGLDDPDYIAARQRVLSQSRENGVDALLADAGVAVLVGPSGPLAPPIDPVNGDVWPAWAGSGSLAARAGYPHLTVPMGTVHAIPIGLSFIGAAGRDADILSYGYAYEQASDLRAEPRFLPHADVQPELGAAMTRR